MGGYSSEADVSLKSAATVVECLDKNKYRPYPILIAKDRWVYTDAQGQEFAIDKNDFSLTLAGEKITFACAFNAIHGTPGGGRPLAGLFLLCRSSYHWL